MKTHTSTRAAWLKGLLLLPLLAILVYGFSETKEEYIENKNFGLSVNNTNVLDISITDESLIFQGNKKIKLAEFENLVHKENYTTAALNVSSKASIPFAKSVVAELVRLNLANQMSVCTSSDGEGNGLSRDALDEIMSPLRNRFQNNKTTSASPKQIEMYNQLAKKYNAVPIAERKIGWQDLKTLEDLYRQMSDTQKENAVPFPECLPKNKRSWEKISRKKISIVIQISKIMINAKPTTLENFAREIDEATKNWATKDFENAIPSVFVAATPDSFMEKVDAEFRKTKYFKEVGKSIIPTSPPPPPPSPDAPKVLKGVNDGDPNIPPPPPAPNVVKGVNDGDTNIPPPPPPPVSPLDHVIEMAKKNATFYFEGKQISSDKAIEIIKTNKDLNIQTTGKSSKNPQVKISTKPISVDTNKKTGAVNKTEREIPKPTAGNVVSHLKVMNRHGATFYLNGTEITFKEALKIVRKDVRRGFTLDVSSDPNKNETYIKGATHLVGTLGKS